MLTGEYLVLAGAKALALPLRKGQAMEIEFTPGQSTKIEWLASDPNGLWFEAELAFEPHLACVTASDPVIAQKLIHLLNAAQSLNPDFLSAPGSYSVNNQMSFNRKWGWGSSSTLISNLAWWAGIDPFELNRLVSDGSGYDIACARSDLPVFYKLQNGVAKTEEIPFHPVFHERIAFIYLGNKQDTSLEISRFVPDPQFLIPAVEEISEITSQIAKTNNLSLFNSLVDKHESILSKVLNHATVKEMHFPDFGGSIKSLGAWGGDFILASSSENYDTTIQYFNERGYPIAFPWKELIR